MSWCEDQRMNWITETLEIFGFINRKHLMKKFQISNIQAAKDLAYYQKWNPEMMTYNLKNKRYEAS